MFQWEERECDCLLLVKRISKEKINGEPVSVHITPAKPSDIIKGVKRATLVRLLEMEGSNGKDSLRPVYEITSNAQSDDRETFFYDLNDAMKERSRLRSEGHRATLQMRVNYYVSLEPANEQGNG